MPEEASFRGFAKHMGVSDMAVRKRVKSGHLSKSVGVLTTGRVGIVSVALAEQEWNATTTRARPGQSKVRTGEPDGSHVGSHGSQGGQDGSQAADEPSPRVPSGEFISSATLLEAQTQATNERARKLKLDNDTRQGRLIAVERVAKDAFEAERIRREAVLNLPARIASELAAEWGLDSNKVYVRLDRALRTALNDLADKYEAVGE